MAKGNKVELATFLVGERTESLVTNQRKIMLCSSVIMAKGNKVELATFLVASDMLATLVQIGSDHCTKIPRLFRGNLIN